MEIEAHGAPRCPLGHGFRGGSLESCRTSAQVGEHRLVAEVEAVTGFGPFLRRRVAFKV